jgi:SAM-dependent methyltransferase
MSVRIDRAAPPFELTVTDTLRFLDRALPAPPAPTSSTRAGEGALAERLAARGHRVVALDRDPAAAAAARARGLEVVEREFLEYHERPFDVVAFTRSLHHMSPIEPALDHARARLEPGGVLVVEEFAVDRVDRDTAAWLYWMEGVLAAEGVLAQPPPPTPEDPLERWRAEHPESLHSADVMLCGIAARFSLRLVEPAAYLYRYLCARLTRDACGAEAARRVLGDERRGIATGRLRAAGLRVVAERR